MEPTQKIARNPKIPSKLSQNQKTIKKDISFQGVGLHSGLNVKLTIKPANANSGIVFKRIDIKENNIVIPNIFNVSSAVFCTTISNENRVSVSTIEHLMAAFYGMGIDNAIVEIDNQEYESKKPLSYITDKFGTFTAFWPYLKIFSPERFDDPIQIGNTQCGHGGLEKLNLKDCLVLAEQNDADALFNLGLMYEKGSRYLRNICSKFLSAQIQFQNFNFIFRILIQFLENKSHKIEEAYN